jgi:hypothetical protein
MLDGGGPACSSPIRVPTTILMNIVLVRKQNKTKQKTKNQQHLQQQQQLHLQKNIHPPLHSLYYLSISLHPGKSSSPPYPHVIPPT